MSIDFTTGIDSETLYSNGYDDGFNGHSKKSDDPDYLEGYFDGQEEAEEQGDWYEYDYADED